MVENFFFAKLSEFLVQVIGVLLGWRAISLYVSVDFSTQRSLNLCFHNILIMSSSTLHIRSFLFLVVAYCLMWCVAWWSDSSYVFVWQTYVKWMPFVRLSVFTVMKSEDLPPTHVARHVPTKFLSPIFSSRRAVACGCWDWDHSCFLVIALIAFYSTSSTLSLSSTLVPLVVEPSSVLQ